MHTLYYVMYKMALRFSSAHGQVCVRTLCLTSISIYIECLVCSSSLTYWFWISFIVLWKSYATTTREKKKKVEKIMSLLNLLPILCFLMRIQMI